MSTIYMVHFEFEFSNGESKLGDGGDLLRFYASFSFLVKIEYKRDRPSFM